MVRAENTKVSMAPRNSPTSIRGLVRDRSRAASDFSATIFTEETSRARAVREAEPMAKPLPVAAVVLPRESRASVRSRTDSGRPDISAMPPALSATGP